MIKENILNIKKCISQTCSKINHNPAEITIIAVSKGRTAEEIKELIAVGITNIGENKVQEVIIKYNKLKVACTGQQIKWHMVGHLQTNKVKDAVKIFDLIHSVDSLKLAQEIDKQAKKINKIQDILIQVNTSFEETKCGVYPAKVIDLVSQMLTMSNIKIKGFMTMAPMVEDPETTRPYFRKLRLLMDQINKTLLNTNYSALSTLSMGMTQDYQIAIEEGANMVRLGRAIFENTG